MELSEKDITRFWGRVIIGEEEECWPWRTEKNPTATVYFRIARKSYTSARVAWTITHGKIPDEKIVYRTCKNVRCANPAHLKLMTRAGSAIKTFRADQMRRSAIKVAKRLSRELDDGEIGPSAGEYQIFKAKSSPSMSTVRTYWRSWQDFLSAAELTLASRAYYKQQQEARMNDVIETKWIDSREEEFAQPGLEAIPKIKQLWNRRLRKFVPTHVYVLR